MTGEWQSILHDINTLTALSDP